ncbi:MAG: Fur family transcriptional regulator [Alphaproteobacteria bacterium]
MTPPGPGGDGHDHRVCVEDALAVAGRVCAERGAQLTALRRRVLELIWASHRSVKAYDLLHQLGTAEKPAKPPTVYRALDFLIEQGLVHKVESLNAYVGCPHPTAPHEGQFLICVACGRVDEMPDPALPAAIQRAALAAGYAVEGQTVEVRGRCAQCRT